MIEIQSGVVNSVDPRPVGSPTVVFAAAGEDVLLVDDNRDFSQGDEVRVTTLDDSEGVLYTIADVDAETGITLSSPIVADLPEGSWVAISPAQYETVASVRMVDSGEVAGCTVLHTLADALRPGIRDESTAETVLVLKVDDTPYVFDIVARQTVRDLSDAIAGTPPAVPDAPVLTTLAYLDEAKKLQSQITATWSPVTENVDGSEITDLDHYDVQIQKSGDGVWQLRTSTDFDITVAYLRPFAPGSQWSVRVRAVDKSGNASPWSTATTITTAVDNLPPSQPSTPTVTTRLGVIRVVWDGKNSTAGAMEDDFAYVEVHASTTSGFTPTPGAAATLIDRLTGPGYALKADPAYGTTWYVKLIAVDTSGNASTPSAQGVGVVMPLVDVSNFPDSAMTELYARTGHFIDLTADNFSSNLVTADFIDFGSLNGELVTGLELQTDPDPLEGIKIKNTGLEGYDSTTHERKFFLNPVTGRLEGTEFIGGTVMTAETGPRMVMSDDAASGRLRGYSGDPDETAPAAVDPGVVGSGGFRRARMWLKSGGFGSGQARVEVRSASYDGSILPQVYVDARLLVDASITAGAGFGGFIDDDMAGGGVTTASINNNGHLFRTPPSTRRVKENIAPHQIDVDAFLDAATVSQFTYTEAVPDVDHNEIQVGLIAEDLADAGFDQWVIRNGAGEISGIPYERLTVPLFAVAQQHQARLDEKDQQIADLTTQLAALADRVTALEGA